MENFFFLLEFLLLIITTSLWKQCFFAEQLADGDLLCAVLLG